MAALEIFFLLYITVNTIGFPELNRPEPQGCLSCDTGDCIPIAVQENLAHFLQTVFDFKLNRLSLNVFVYPFHYGS